MQPVTPKLIYKNNTLYFENVEIKKIIERFSTPVYVYSKNQIIENFLNYKKALKQRNHIICFAMKANSNLQILKIIKDLGGGCDVTSGGEIFRALNAGIEPRKIVYAGVGKTQQEIEYALKNKILMLNIESKDEVLLLEKIAKRKKIKIDISVRINPEVTTTTISYISTGEEGTKFGIPIKEAESFIKYVKNLKNLNLVGLHFHIGSQICNVKPFVEATKKVTELIKKMKLKLRYLDIGGGLGIRYKNETPPTPEELMDELLKHIPEDLTIICEPGRYIVGNAGILVSKVLYHKNVKNKKFLIIDASMTDLIRPAFYDAYHNIIPLNLNLINNSKIKKYEVAGPVCETSDFLGKNIRLPEISNGDYVVIETTGAYGFVMSSNYNSRLKVAEVMVDDNKFYLIRKRDTYQDLINKELKVS